MTMYVCYAWLAKLSLAMLDDRMFSFTNTATISYPLEVLLNEKKVRKNRVMEEKRQGMMVRNK
jgi:hypothetical protein